MDTFSAFTNAVGGRLALLALSGLSELPPTLKDAAGAQYSDQDGAPVDALPHYIPPNESQRTAPALAALYPLSLISPKSHAFLNSNYAK